MRGVEISGIRCNNGFPKMGRHRTISEYNNKKTDAVIKIQSITKIVKARKIIRESNLTVSNQFCRFRPQTESVVKLVNISE